MKVTMWYKVEQLTLSENESLVRVKLREESDFSFRIINKGEPYIVGSSETWFEMEMGVDDNDLELGDMVRVEMRTVAFAPGDEPQLDIHPSKLKRKDNKREYIPPAAIRKEPSAEDYAWPIKGTPDDDE